MADTTRSSGSTRRAGGTLCRASALRRFSHRGVTAHTSLAGGGALQPSKLTPLPPPLEGSSSGAPPPPQKVVVREGGVQHPPLEGSSWGGRVRGEGYATM